LTNDHVVLAKLDAPKGYGSVRMGCARVYQRTYRKQPRLWVGRWRPLSVA
jgi:hypothetical protein